MEKDRKIIVAMTGATGAVFGIKLLTILKEFNDIETHFVYSRWAEQTICLESPYQLQQIKDMADYCYENDNLGAGIASGSFLANGMVIIPCSMKTLSAVAHGYADNLIVRAADVMLKERRTLIVVPRETPLNVIHLTNMLTLARAGGLIVPPMPAFYHQPKTIDEIISHFCGRILDLLGIPNEITRRWQSVGEKC